MIRRTDTLHSALKDVARREVAFHSGYSAHPRGFGWHNGGEVPQDEQLALSELTVVRLVGLLPAKIGGGYGSQVTLTVEGQRVLSEWDADTDSPARTSGVHRAGETQGGER